VAFAAGGGKEVTLAQEAGQAWLDSTVETPEWIGACLTTPQVCYGLDGQPSAYMFTIENNSQVVGHMIVGSSAYGYPVFEAADCPPPSIPSADEVKSTLGRDLGLKLARIGGPTRLLYLGFDNLFAVYRTAGQEAAVNLVFDFAIPAANLTAAMPSPEVYKANKEATREAISDLLESSDYSSLSLPPSGEYSLPMYYYSNSTTHKTACGPCSGVSIGWYYKTRSGSYGPSYPNLPPTKEAMYDRLFTCMGTDSNGGTWPWNYGPGFIAMTEDPDGNPATPGYDNFEYYSVFWPSHAYYANIVSWINRGWPTAVCATTFYYELEGDPPGGGDWPPAGGHCIAIKGYKFPYNGNVQYSVICTDSYCSANRLYLNWDHMTFGIPPYDITIWDS